jgi:hypothetical protein
LNLTELNESLLEQMIVEIGKYGQSFHKVHMLPTQVITTQTHLQSLTNILHPKAPSYTVEVDFDE